MISSRIMIAAPKSGSGKTLITCALLSALKKRGMKVRSFKCGPDYIDPMFHREVIGIPSKNLDTFFTGEETTRSLFLRGADGYDISVIEGVMGLFDGLGGVDEVGSSYHLAKITKTPIVLVVDAKGMGKSVVALIAGFLKYDTEGLIAGVILNRMSKVYFDILKPYIESDLGIRVLGYFKYDETMNLESRHLGLVLPDEVMGLRATLDRAAESLEETVDVEAMISIAGENEPLTGSVLSLTKYSNGGAIQGTESVEVLSVGVKRPVIAVAKDEAFCFIYEDNIRLLEEAGAKVRYFSPIHDKRIPEESSGLLLSGGYPENYLPKLSQNNTMLESIRKAYDSDMPVVAECGGFMYLHRTITDKDGNAYKMVGAIDADCHYTGKLVRFGYVEITEKSPSFLHEGEIIKGHEFHYFDSDDNGAGVCAIKASSHILLGKAKGYDCIHTEKTNKWVGFPHLYYPSDPDFAVSFVRKASFYLKNENN